MNITRRGFGLVTAVGLLLASAACGSDDDAASGASDVSDAPAASDTSPATDDVAETDGDDNSGEDDGATTTVPTGDGDTVESGIVGEQSDAEPTDGGDLTFGVFSEPAGLDPTVAVGNGTAGGIEMAAIYDTLMRYDSEAGEYEPQLAESLEVNDDFTQFTMTLREGVTFTDGTPLDADAVVASMQRHLDNQSRYAPIVASIESFDTPDEATVVFDLTEPWAGFPYVLSTSPGMITSPTAVDELGDEAFNGAPVGAGPFVVERYAAGEELKLAANDDYWNGRPHLDELRFVPVLGGQNQLDALRAGDLQATFLRDPAAIASAREEGIGGYRNNLSLGSTWLINHGVRGQDRPAADERVRLAMAYAIDPEIIDDRAYDGAGIPSRDLVSPTSPYYDETSEITYDPDRASELVEEVKAETGWDGSIEIVCSNDSAGSERSLATSGMLEAAGFQPEVTGVASISDIIERVAVDAQFDLACWGFNVDDSSPYEAFALHLGMESPSNFTGFQSEELEGLIHELKLAADDAARTEVLNDIQALFDEQVPVVQLGPTMEFVAWDDSVHGVRPSVKTMVLFDQAYVADG